MPFEPDEPSAPSESTFQPEGGSTFRPDPEVKAVPVAQPKPEPVTPSIPLNPPRDRSLPVTDPRYAATPVTPSGTTWANNMQAGLKEDARRVSKAAGQAVDVVKGVGGTIGDVVKADASTSLFDYSTEHDLQGSPYQDIHNTARELDSFLNRPALGQLQTIGHGIAPDTVPAPPAAPTTPGVVTTLSLAKDKAMNPVVKGIDYAQEHVGKPFVDAMAQRVGTQTPEESKNLDTLEFLFRQAGSSVGGEKAGPNPELPYTLNAINNLESQFGPTGSAVVQTAAEMVGQAPFYLLSSGIGSRAVKAERDYLLGTSRMRSAEATFSALKPLAAKEALIEGAAQGAIMTGITPGADVVSGPSVMALLGAVGGKAAAGSTAKNQLMEHWAAVVKADSWDQFGQGLNDLVTKAQFRSRAKGKDVRPLDEVIFDVVNGNRVVGRATVLDPKHYNDAIEPLFNTVFTDADGNLVGRQVQGRVFGENPATQRINLAFKDTPLPNDAAISRWKKTVKGSVRRPSASPDPKANADYARYLNAEYPTTPDVDDIALPIRGGGAAAPEEGLRHPLVRLRLENEAAQQQAILDKSELEATLPQSDATPVVVTVNPETQALEATYVHPGRNKTTRTWDIQQGDLIRVPTTPGQSGTDPDLVKVVYKVDEQGVWARKVGSKGKGVCYRGDHVSFVGDKEALPMFLLHKRQVPSKYLDEGVKDALLSYETLTIPRVMAETGQTSAEAAHTLRFLEDQGAIKHQGMGYFTVKGYEGPSTKPLYGWGKPPVTPGGAKAKGPNKPPANPIPPGLTTPIMDGMEVWFATTPNGTGIKGVLRGADPKKPGHYLLEVPYEGVVSKLEAIDALDRIQDPRRPGVVPSVVQGVQSGGGKTRLKSVPESFLRTTVPVNLAKPSLQKLFAQPGLFGLTVPHPPNFVVTSKGQMEAMQQAVNTANRVRLPTLKAKTDTLIGALLNSYYLTPTSLRRKATPLFSLWPASRDAMMRVSERIGGGVGGLGSEADRNLQDVMDATAGHPQTQAIAKYAAQYPKEWADIHHTLKSLLAERKALSQWAASRGFPGVDQLEMLRDVGEETEYLTMMYNVRVLKDKYPQWARDNIPDVWDAAVAELARGTRNAAKVEGELAEVLQQKDPLEALGRSSLVDGKAFKKLMARQDFAKQYPAIYKLMGPVDSPSLRLGHTIGYQRAIKRAVETWDSIADSGWWSQGQREDLKLHIPNEPRFGKAAGGWTHESLANFVTKKPGEEASSWGRMLGFMGGKWKSFHTVYGGPTPWVNNVLRNLKGVALSGAFQEPGDIAGFRQAPALLLAWRENPSMLGPANVVGEAKQFNALSSGLAGAEIETSRKRIQDELLRTMTRAAGKANTMEDMVMAAQEFMRGKTENVKDAYDAIDQFFKLATYINLKKRFTAQGMSQHDAAAMASERINASYPNFELVGPVVEQMRGKFGWVAPFLSSKAEDLRINAMTMARIKRGLTPGDPMAEPDLVLRLAALGATTYGASSLMQSLRRSNGTSDQDVEDATNDITQRQQGWRPALIAMWDRDAKGRVQFIDLTPTEDLFMMMRGNPSDPVINRMFVNTMTDLVGDNTWAGRGIQHKAQAAGLISQPPEELKPIGYGEGGVLSFLGDFAANGGFPQAPLRVAGALEKTEEHPWDPKWEPWTQPQAWAKAAGLPMAGPVGQGNMVQSLLEAKGQVRGLKQEAKQIPRRLGDPSSMDQERAKFLLDAKLRGLGAVQDRVQSIVPPKGTGGSK